MPKKIDEQLKVRAVRLVTEHQQEYPSLTAYGPSPSGDAGVRGRRPDPTALSGCAGLDGNKRRLRFLNDHRNFLNN